MGHTHNKGPHCERRCSVEVGSVAVFPASGLHAPIGGVQSTSGPRGEMRSAAIKPGQKVARSFGARAEPPEEMCQEDGQRGLTVVGPATLVLI